MCGIAGFNWHDPDLIEQMAASLAHRGPDGQGLLCDDRVSLGHRRLAIIDLSRAGTQPMTVEHCTIVYNGEIYNYLELRRRLQRDGVVFTSHTDTEVVLQSYLRWGADCVNRFNGMWAFCIYDRRRHHLFLSRDRFGIKPLLYYRQGRQFAFASELKALRSLTDRQDINIKALNAFFYQKYIGSTRTIWRHCHKLQPGTNLIYNLRYHKLWVECYYDLEHEIAECRRQGVQDRCERIVSSLQNAVSSRLISDVPVGSFLSGGLDSSLIAALIAADHDRFKTFSIGFAETSFDESGYSQRVADHLGTDHRVKTLPMDDDLIQRVLDHLDEPFGDASVLPTSLLSQITRQDVTVALSGDAADEVFAGYDSYFAWQLARHIPPWVVRTARPLLNTLPPSDRKLSSLFKLQKFANDFHPLPQRRHLNWMATCNDQQRQALLNEAFRPGEQLLPVTQNGDLRSMQLLDIHHYLAEDILKKVDAASMMHSLEVRVPYLDYRLVPAVLSLPRTYRLRGRTTKWILKRIASFYLPDRILHRRKRGFTVPIAAWIRRSNLMRAWLTDDSAFAHGLLNRNCVRHWLDEHDAHQVDRARPLWLVFVFNYWYSRYGRSS